MNEIGQVLSWKLTSSRKFDAVEKELVSLNERFKSHSDRPDLIIVDNCCSWRKKLQKVFGSDITVKLDLFHAVQRVTLTLSKKLDCSQQCASEFGQVFIHDDDVLDKSQRKKDTLNPTEIRTKLSKWLRKLEAVKESGQSVLTKETKVQIKKLEKHIDKGCVSGIRPSCGTNINERFHSFLQNAGLSFRRIGPELAEALLALHIHKWNERQFHTHTNKKRKLNPSTPTESYQIERIISNIKRETWGNS